MKAQQLEGLKTYPDYFRRLQRFHKAAMNSADVSLLIYKPTTVIAIFY